MSPTYNQMTMIKMAADINEKESINTHFIFIEISNLNLQ